LVALVCFAAAAAAVPLVLLPWTAVVVVLVVAHGAMALGFLHKVCTHTGHTLGVVVGFPTDAQRRSVRPYLRLMFLHLEMARDLFQPLWPIC